MIKYYCDLCGKEIKDGDYTSSYKVKKLQHSWYESWWERIYAHESCCDKFIEEVLKRKKEVTKGR